MITYFSIDVVGSVTAMDGNVLENESYGIAYEEMIDKFKDERNQAMQTCTGFAILLVGTVFQTR